jgi:hypothetical protein
MFHVEHPGLGHLITEWLGGVFHVEHCKIGHGNTTLPD